MYLYSLRFTKEDHINFIKLLYEVMTVKNLDHTVVESFALVLNALLK